jgi:D-sedoheptulose 7-phosphate isomerase
MNISIVEQATKFSDLMRRCVATATSGTEYELEDAIGRFCGMLQQAGQSGRSVYVVGNGGSAAVASHAVTDFVNVACLKATTLHESSLLTCMANDYGYENAYARMLSQMLQPGDIVIAISSSGQSMNIRNAAQHAEEKGAAVVTLSGFKQDNPLRTLGELNFWLDSDDYGMVEIGHQFILHNVSDRLRETNTGIGYVE